MTSSRHGLPIAAALVTVLMALLVSRDEIEAQAVAGFVNWLAVPALWAAAVLAGADWRLLRVAVPASLVAAVGLGGWVEGGILASLTAAGLVAAWGLVRRWRLVPLLAMASLALIPTVALPLAGTTYPEAMAEQLGLWREQYQEQVLVDRTAVERETALADFDQTGAGVLRLIERFWPSMVLTGLISQTVMFLLAGWGLARLLVKAPARPRLTPLAVWRAPFAAVWVLIGGLALSLAGQGTAALIGWNLVVLAASFLVIQGLGVQAWLVARVMSPVGQVVFWVLGTFFFAPALIGGGALIGLADQWMDLRRLRRPPENDDQT